MSRKGVEFTLLLIEPGLWKWRFQVATPSSWVKRKPTSWAWPPTGFINGSTASLESSALRVLGSSLERLSQASRGLFLEMADSAEGRM
jgi:hypothetical protein